MGHRPLRGQPGQQPHRRGPPRSRRPRCPRREGASRSLWSQDASWGPRGGCPQGRTLSCELPALATPSCVQGSRAASGPVGVDSPAQAQRSGDLAALKGEQRTWRRRGLHRRQRSCRPGAELGSGRFPGDLSQGLAACGERSHHGLCPFPQKHGPPRFPYCVWKAVLSRPAPRRGAQRRCGQAAPRSPSHVPRRPPAVRGSRA